MKWDPGVAKRRLRELFRTKKKPDPERPPTFTPKKRRRPPQEETP